MSRKINLEKISDNSANIITHSTTSKNTDITQKGLISQENSKKINEKKSSSSKKVNENNELSLKINDYEEQNIPNPKYYLTNNTYLLYIMSSNNTSNEYESLESSNMDCEEKFAFYEKKDNSNLYQMNLNIDLNEENYVENVRKSEKRRKKRKTKKRRRRSY